ncbi:MAG: FxSxx-COOH cyclophane-containing RiPP peptide [Pseudonocardiaceae bacterium]
MNDVEPPYESILIDVTDITLEQLRASDDSTLTHAVRRALREAQEKPQVLAAFSNLAEAFDSSPDPHCTHDGAAP